MGMSASQVRFLTLQGRKNSIGRQLTTLSNRKLALSRDMDAVAMRYNNALNQKVLRWSNDSGETYNALSYDLMMRPNELNWERPYIVTKASTGTVVLNSDKIKKYALDADGQILSLTDATTDLSYVSIAKMISSCTGIDSVTGSPMYDTTGSNFVYDANGNIVGGKAAPQGWYIPTAHDYTYNNSFRMDIFNQLGLVSDADKALEIQYLDELYGSKAAQQAGVYPTSSLWGKYYIALANLNAFEEYFNVPHKFASSDSFAGTQRTTGTYTTVDTQFSYVDNINATRVDPNTNSSQNKTAPHRGVSEALDHIDFSDANTLPSSEQSQTYRDADKDFSFSTNVTTSGISYNYGFESVWERGLKKLYPSYETNGTTGDQFVDAILDYNNKEKQLYRLGTWRDREIQDTPMKGLGDTLEDGSLDMTTSGNRLAVPQLETIIDSFAKVIEANDLVNMSSADPKNKEIYDKAKDETIRLFCMNRNVDYGGTRGRANTERHAADDANGLNAIAFHGTHRKGWPVGHCYSSAFVDIKSLYHVYMSYVDQMKNGETLNPVEHPVDCRINIPDDIESFSNIDDGVKNIGAVKTQGAANDVVYDSLVTDNVYVTNADGTVSTQTKSYSRAKYNYVYDAATDSYQLASEKNPYYDASNPSTWNVFGSGIATGSKSVNGNTSYPETDANGNILYDTYMDGTTLKTHTDSDGHFMYQTASDFRYATAPSSGSENVHDLALYKDASGKAVALYTYDSATGSVTYNGDSAILSQSDADKIRVQDPTHVVAGSAELPDGWNQADANTWTGKLSTVITDSTDGRKKTLAEYYLEHATTDAEKMKYARCEEVKNYYSDYDECWSVLSGHDTANNTYVYEYQKLEKYIQSDDFITPTATDSVTGQSIYKSEPKVSYDAANGKYVNNATDGKIVKDVWVMDPTNPGKLIELSASGIALNSNGLPKDPNVAVYIEYDTSDDENPDFLTNTNNMGISYAPGGYEWTYNSNGDKKTIYGTLSYNAQTYYFENKADIDRYIAHPDPDGLCHNPSAYGAQMWQATREMSSATYDDYDASIEREDGSSKYNISMIEQIGIDEPVYKELQDAVTDAKTAIDEKEKDLDTLHAKNGKVMDYYDALFTKVAQSGWSIDENTSNSKETSNTYLNNKLQNNDYFVTMCESKIEKKGYNYTTKMAQSITKIYEVYDEDACDTAIAEYECEKKELQSKEDQIDLVMEKLETEQEAVETTMKSVKKIIEDNIKKTFKMFA